MSQTAPGTVESESPPAPIGGLSLRDADIPGSGGVGELDARAQDASVAGAGSFGG